MNREYKGKNVSLFIGGSIFIVILYLAVILGSHKFSNERRVYLEKGLVTVDEMLNKDELLRLDGEWEFYPNQLLTPEDFDGLNQCDYLHLPIYLEQVDIKYRYGYGTVRGTVLLNDIDHIYALKVKHFTSASKIFIDGQVRKSVGKVAATEENYKFCVSSEAMSFMPTEDEVEIIIQYANFYNTRVKFTPIYFGRQEAIQKFHYKAMIEDSVLFGIILVIGIFSMIFYIATMKNKIFFYLGWISLVLAIRTGVLGERILVRLIPVITGEIMMKLAFLSAFIFTPLVILYLIELFKLEWYRFQQGLLGYIAVITVIVIATDMAVYDYLMKYIYVVFVVMALVVLVLISRKVKVFQLERIAASGGLLLLTCAGISDYMKEFFRIQVPDLIYHAFVVFLGIQIFLVVWKENREHDKAKKLAVENEKMLCDIKKMNEELEERISERTDMLKQSNIKLMTLTNTDALTGLLNRRGFDYELNKMWLKAAKYGQIVSVLMIDIDDFKAFNDYYGHLEGDACLKSIARELKSFVEETKGIACRFGGEEFVVLYCGQNREEIFIHAKRLCRRIENIKIKSATTAKYVTVSIGVNSQIPKVDEDYKDFIDGADVALYNAKSNGKNQVRI